MADKIDDFGPISQGYDRSQIGVAPPFNNGTANIRPPESSHRRQSIHVIISDNLPLLLTHPRRGIRRFKNAVGERNSNNPSPTSPHIAPILAPEPHVEANPVRLHTDLEDEPKLPPVKDLISHPVSTVKSFVADKSGIQFSENLAKSEVPHSASVNLLIQDQENSKATTAEEENEGLLKLTQLKHLRQDAFVRWTVDRHIREVRKVQPPAELSKQNSTCASQTWRASFKQSLEKRLMDHAEFYIDESTDWPQPSRQILTSSFERIVVASTQMQTWYMDVRAISHWDDPRKTAVYALAYVLLVVTGHVPSMMLLFLMCKVWMRRREAPNLQSMRESVAASEDQTQTAKHLNELIVQYGTQGWVDHAIEIAGPTLHIKLEHIADVFEVMQNFYEWRDPFRTVVSLCILAALLLATTILPSWVLVKVSFFLIGINFFVLSPIGYHYPEFRLLVSPFTWILWRVPTHADWALARLQAEGRDYRLGRQRDGSGKTELISGSVDAENNRVASENDHRPEKIGTYLCENNPEGVLDVTTASISFTGRKKENESWIIQLKDLNSLQKISEPTRTSYISGLRFRTTAGLEFRVMGLERRDEIFSQIVGYSEAQWKRIN